MTRRSAAFVGALLIGLVAGQARPEEGRAGSDPDEVSQRSSSATDRRLLLFPPGHLFQLPIADPHRPGSAIQRESCSSTEIEGASDQRFHLQLGGRFGMLRWLPKREGGRIWQLSIEAGLDALFDVDNAYDNIGWEGNYGLSVTTSRGGRWAWLIGILHTSSHIGDEWIDRTGRERVNYSREEARGAVSWRFARRWRAYGEGAYGYTLRSYEDVMEPLRGQIGVEFEAPESLWSGRAGWYAAVDLSSWEERDWRLDVSVQSGLMFVRGERVWRVGLQYYDGRVPQGEFFRETEMSLSLGLWTNL